jgi:superfamily II DNA or RNA helicase
MDQNTSPVFFDNVTNRVIDDLKVTIRPGSKVDIAAASFSIYAYQLLKKELEQVEELNFLFTGEVFTSEKAQRESREFYIPRLNAERSLYGTDFEVKLRNELNQQAIAKECADWIRRKAKFKSNVSGEHMSPFMAVRTDQSEAAYLPFNNFTTADLGADRGNSAYSVTTKVFAPASKHFIDTFETVWNGDGKIADVTDSVLENITAAYKENSPELIYFTALYNIFSEFLEDLNADYLPNEATGYKNSQIWSKLYDFQKDAVMGCISKLEKHNGCILADSVGIGKTFSALGVIKYYESRNKNVLVLVPKRLKDNWNTFKGNYKNNPIAEDRLRYDVLFHTDMNRERGESNGIDLQNLNWGNYDLVVIDESHNFRNGESSSGRKVDDEYENRYQKLMSRIIRDGVKTKVLMLSATPVNNRFTDLRNQLMLASEGDSSRLDESLNTQHPVEKIFRDASAAFKAWNELPPDERTTPTLLEMLHFDFFELLDSVTIARSRKHIERYYSLSDVGKFPSRLKPISERPELTDIEGVTFNEIFSRIDSLNMDVYTPMKYVFPSKLGKYVDLSSSQGRSWANRETGRNVLMITNMLKRLESSIYAFRKTSERMYDLIDGITDGIDRFEQGRSANSTVGHYDVKDFDADDSEDEWTVGKDLKIDLEDIDLVSWRDKLDEDKVILQELLAMIAPVADENDLKLQRLVEIIRDKVNHPLNGNNKKILVFTAFADTADYLYGELAEKIKTEFGLNSAVVTGTRNPGMTIPTTRILKAEFNTILTLFSPRSKNRDALFDENPGEIDILFATDCISEGQNLQDCDYLINYDIHWNPVRIIQRFGRIDRIGSSNAVIQLTNFWPNISLDEYINLKARVEGRMRMVNLAATGNDNPIDQADNAELEYRKNQLERIQNEVVDIEEMGGGVSIMDMGLNEFHLDLQELLKKYGDADQMPFGIHAVARASEGAPSGVIFVLKNVNHGVNIDKQNRLHPFYLVYITDDGQVSINHLQSKDLLDKLRLFAKGNDTPDADLVAKFNAETDNGKSMDKYSTLLGSAIESMISTKTTKDIDSLFTVGGTSALENEITGLDQFELINFLVVK